MPAGQRGAQLRKCCRAFDGTVPSGYSPRTEGNVCVCAGCRKERPSSRRRRTERAAAMISFLPRFPNELEVHDDGYPNVPAREGSWLVALRSGYSRTHQLKASMADLAGILSNQLEKPVTDATGLKGDTNSHCRGWRRFQRRPPHPRRRLIPGPTFRAVQQQLGLKLAASKAPVDVLVIDYFDRDPGGELEMTWLELWTQTPLAKALAWTLLHSLWERAAAAFCWPRPWRATLASRALWAACAALLALLAAFTTTLARLWPARRRAAAAYGASARAAANRYGGFRCSLRRTPSTPRIFSPWLRPSGCWGCWRFICARLRDGSRRGVYAARESAAQRRIGPARLEGLAARIRISRAGDALRIVSRGCADDNRLSASYHSDADRIVCRAARRGGEGDSGA